MLKFISHILFRFALQPLNRVLYGGTYKVAHIDSTTGKRKVFWCCTWQDAIEWVACACNDDRVTVTDTAAQKKQQEKEKEDKAKLKELQSKINALLQEYGASLDVCLEGDTHGVEAELFLSIGRYGIRMD